MTANNSNQQPDGAPTICPECGKVQREIREGSLTSWIFLESRCQCAIIGTQPEQPSPSNANPTPPPTGGAPNSIPFSLPHNAAPPAAPSSPNSAGAWPKPTLEKPLPQRPMPAGPIAAIAPSNPAPPAMASSTPTQAAPSAGPQAAAPVQYDLVPPSPQGAAQLLLAVGAASDSPNNAAVKQPEPVQQKGGWPSPARSPEALRPAPQPCASSAPLMEAPTAPRLPEHSHPPSPQVADASPHQYAAPPPPPVRPAPAMPSAPVMDAPTAPRQSERSQVPSPQVAYDSRTEYGAPHSSAPPVRSAPPMPPTPPPLPVMQDPFRSSVAAMPPGNGQHQLHPAAPRRADDALDLVDKVIGRHYKILELIGQGGMSRVYRASHLLLNRTVAVKYINPKFVHDHKSVQRFQQEAKAAAALKHPNICAVNEFGMDEEGRPFLVMDFVDGISLSDVLKRQSPLNPEHALTIIEQVCQALVHAHGYGVVHRDIKPGNIVLTRNIEGKEIVKLVDFGLAKLTDPEDEKRQNLTKTGEVLGTPYYMSPEQCIGRKVDVRSDLYSVGCVLFELLTGRPPFQSDNTIMTLMAHVNEAPPALSEGLHSQLLSRIVERCLRKDPDQRFQTSSELLREISKAQTIADGSSRDHDQHSDSPDIIGNRYQILDIIGQGGMGTVLKARHLALSKLVAIKVLNPGRNFDDQSKKRFEQEAQAGSKLSHPNLVAVFDYGFTAKREPYLVMEYIDGESLEKILARAGHLDLDQFVEVFKQSCKGLNYIHKNGIVHRDIKPSNIIVQVIEGDSYVKLLDFGVAKILQEGAAAQQLTATGMIFGSPLYMSPEQCIGKKIDLRSDIYSLGCVMYECIAGQPPHQGDNSLHTLHMHINERAPDLGMAKRGRAAAAIEAIIKRCLEKDPEVRYQTAAELLSDLNAVDGRYSSGLIPALEGAPRAVASSRPEPPSAAERSQTNAVVIKTPSDVNQRMVQFDLMSRSQPVKSRSSSGEHSANSSGTSSDGATTQSRMIEQQPSLAASSPHATWLKLAIPLLVAIAVICFIYPPSQIVDNLSFGGVSGNTINKSFVMAEETFKKGSSDYDKAMDQYAMVLKSADSVKDAETIGKVFARLGRINYAKQRYAQASGEFKKALKALKQRMTVNKEYYLDSVYGMAQSLSAQRSYERAEEYFSESRKLAGLWETESKQAVITFESARNEAHNNGKDALELYDQAIIMFRKLRDQNDKLAACLVESAVLLEKIGDSKVAVSRAKEALGYANGLGDFREVEQRANDLIRKNGETSSDRQKEPARYQRPIATPDPVMPSFSSSQLSIAKPIEYQPATIYQNPVDLRARSESMQRTMRMMDDLRHTQAIEMQRAQNAMRVPSIPAPALQPSFRSTSTSIPSYSTGSNWSHPASPTLTPGLGRNTFGH